jgi:hypothetical protein
MGDNPLRPAAKPPDTSDQLIPLKPADIQTASMVGERFKDVEYEEKYLYTIDDQGIHIAREHSGLSYIPDPVKHTNFGLEAKMAGEVWFHEDGMVTINPGSGRFGDRSPAFTETSDHGRSLWRAAITAWEDMGYQVIPTYRNL